MRSEERILGKFCVHMWNFPSERSNGSMWAECLAVLSSFLFGARLALPCYILSTTLLSTCICIPSLLKWGQWQGLLVVTEGNRGQSSGLGLLWTWPAWCGLWTSIRYRLYLAGWILNLKTCCKWFIFWPRVRAADDAVYWRAVQVVLILVESKKPIRVVFCSSSWMFELLCSMSWTRQGCFYIHDWNCVFSLCSLEIWFGEAGPMYMICDIIHLLIACISILVDF